jgi:hypothetical protein
MMPPTVKRRVTYGNPPMSILHVATARSIQDIVAGTILDQGVAVAIANVGKLGLEVVQVSTGPIYHEIS